MSAETAPSKNRWRRRFFVLLAAWLLSTFLLSFPANRAWIATPLWVHDENTRGEAAYVMADGHAYWERLHAASDLYNMRRVPRILILDESDTTKYSFVRGRSETLAQRATAYLVMHGVPEDRITRIPRCTTVSLGTLSEAHAVANAEKDLKNIIVVTSAPHTRRSRLSFQRSLPKEVKILVYAASSPEHSAEVYAPIWHEYVKLVVYWFVA